MYQNNKHTITPQSLNSFRRISKNYLAPVCDPFATGPTFQPVGVINTYRAGARNFQTQRLVEYECKTASKFTWGYHPQHSDAPEDGQSSDMTMDTDESETEGQGLVLSDIEDEEYDEMI